MVRAIPLLEPLLLGYLSTISQTKIKQELDIDLVQRACRYLDTNLISPALPRKLRQFGLLNSAIFLYQNQNCLQFDISEKVQTIQALGGHNLIGDDRETQKTFFENLFPNKDIDTGQFNQVKKDDAIAQQMNTVMEDRNDIILKLSNDPNYCQEREILREKLRQYASRYQTPRNLQSEELDSVKFAFEVAELLNDWQFAIGLLKSYKNGQYLHRFKQILVQSNEQMRYQGMIEFIDIIQNYPNQSQPVILTFKNERRQTWLQNVNVLFQEDRAPQ